MKVTRLSPDNHRRMPWKNGLGVTTEIARSPQTGDSYNWRVSVADVVSDGPFSTFDGMDRIILTIQGDGMILTHPEREQTVTLGGFELYAFPGEWVTTCRLRGGPIRDFNVMTRRDTTRAEVEILSLSSVKAVAVESATAMVYCASGSCRVEAGGKELEVRCGETIRIDEADDSDSLALVPAGTVVLVWVSISGV